MKKLSLVLLFIGFSFQNFAQSQDAPSRWSDKNMFFSGDFVYTSVFKHPFSGFSYSMVYAAKKNYNAGFYFDELFSATGFDTKFQYKIIDPYLHMVNIGLTGTCFLKPKGIFLPELSLRAGATIATVFDGLQSETKTTTSSSGKKTSTVSDKTIAENSFYSIQPGFMLSSKIGNQFYLREGVHFNCCLGKSNFGRAWQYCTPLLSVGISWEPA